LSIDKCLESFEVKFEENLFLEFSSLSLLHIFEQLMDPIVLVEIELCFLRCLFEQA